MAYAYDPASGKCQGRSQPGAWALMRWALDEYPTAANLGIYACRNVRGGRSKSVHADGRAGDTAFPLEPDGGANPLGHDFAARLVLNAERLGVQLVIFDQLIWKSTTRAWSAHCGHAGARGPHGRCSGPHFDHVHWELNWDGARNLLRSDIDRALGPADGQQEDDMPQPTTIVDALVTPDGKGVWLLQYDGGVITKNGARYYGSYPGLPPEQRQGERNFVAIEPHRDGYALVATDGSIYRFPRVP